MAEIQNRFNIKSFKYEKIEKESIERILEAGRQAPSAKNRQPWRFIVLQSDEKKEALRNLCYGDQRVIDAGAVIAICTTNIDYKMPNGELSYPMDLAMATSFMLLQAEHEGFGTALLTTFQEKGVRDLLTVPYRMKVGLLLLVGQVSELDEDSKLRRRHSLDRISSFEHW